MSEQTPINNPTTITGVEIDKNKVHPVKKFFKKLFLYLFLLLILAGVGSYLVFNFN